jgi:RNA polymerase sigma-70 factor (ECF subfamily)
MAFNLGKKNKTSEFEAIVLPHLDAAYSLARWLTRSEHNAEDLVQMAYMRAFRFFDGFRGGDARVWLLAIVRNTYYTWLRDNRHLHGDVSFDEDLHGQDGDGGTSPYDVGNNPEDIVAGQDLARVVNQALESLPQAFREVIVLKEIDDFSYKEIAEIADIPLGTVMSRLARGRKLLGDYLRKHAIGE